MLDIHTENKRLCTEKHVAEFEVTKLRGNHQVQVKALEKELRVFVRFREKSRVRDEAFDALKIELHESKFENQILREKSRGRVERNVSQDQAEFPEEQERHTQLESGDENPDDDNAASVASLYSSSDADSFDTLLSFEDKILPERSLLQDEACEFDLSLDAVEKRENEMKFNRLINGKTIELSQTVALLYDDVIKEFLDNEEICGIRMACVVVGRDAGVIREFWALYGHASIYDSSSCLFIEPEERYHNSSRQCSFAIC